MGGVTKLVGGLFGMNKTPKVSNAAASEVKSDQDSVAAEAKAARKALFATEGGILGSVLQTDEVAKRQTLFGN